MYELEATANMLVMTGQGKASIDRSASRASRPKPRNSPAERLESIESQNPSSCAPCSPAIRDTFGRLYELYAPLVHGVLLARMPRSEVEDTVQDIFLHALRKLHTLRDANAFGPWIAMIARNRAMDFHRRSRETSSSVKI